MAEGVFRSLTRNDSRVGNIDSAGTGAYHTLEPPDCRTVETLRKHGISDYDHGARKVENSDFDAFDYIFAMDGHNLRDLQRTQRRLESKGKKTSARVMLFGTYGGSSKPEEVVEPYYGADDGFGEVYEQVGRFSRNFLKDVVHESKQ